MPILKESSAFKQSTHVDPNEALAQQLDPSFWTKAYQEIGVNKQNNGLNTELAKYIVANIELIASPLLVRKLKLELNNLI